MIRFPKTERLVERARELRVPIPVVVRDLARTVEILNLRDRGFFDARNVLAGGMAMRTFGSQRLTIYDADLSARAVVAPTEDARLQQRRDRDQAGPAPSHVRQRQGVEIGSRCVRAVLAHAPARGQRASIQGGHGRLSTTQRGGVRFLHNPYTPERVVQLVRERYVPLLKGYP